RSNEIIGVLDTAKSGSGYVIVEGMDNDIFIQEQNLGKALSGDKVSVAIIRVRGKKMEGKVTAIIERKQRIIVGTLQVQDHFSFLIPDDPKINIDIFIPGSNLNGGKDGFKAIGKITDWPDTAKNPFGEIIEVLGKPGSNE